MLKTWTDTHYQLEDNDWIYIAKHDEQGAVSLVCPGYARDGQGFSIHFSTAHIEMLSHLLATLQNLKAQQETATATSQPVIEMYAECETPSSGEYPTSSSPDQYSAYSYPDPTPAANRHVIR